MNDNELGFEETVGYWDEQFDNRDAVYDYGMGGGHQGFSTGLLESLNIQEAV